MVGVSFQPLFAGSAVANVVLSYIAFARGLEAAATVTCAVGDLLIGWGYNASAVNAVYSAGGTPSGWTLIGSFAAQTTGESNNSHMDGQYFYRIATTTSESFNGYAGNSGTDVNGIIAFRANVAGTWTIDTHAAHATTTINEDGGASDQSISAAGITAGNIGGVAIGLAGDDYAGASTLTVTTSDGYSLTNNNTNSDIAGYALKQGGAAAWTDTTTIFGSDVNGRSFIAGIIAKFTPS